MILFQIFLRKKTKLISEWMDVIIRTAVSKNFLFFFLIFVLYFFIPEVVAQNFNSIAERSISTRTRNVKTFLMLITYQFILLYFSNEIIFCFIYICQSKFLAYVFFKPFFNVIIYFSLKQFLISQLILLL